MKQIIKGQISCKAFLSKWVHARYSSVVISNLHETTFGQNWVRSNLWQIGAQIFIFWPQNEATDKDPSVVVGNEVIYANTWKALVRTFYFQCKMNTGEKLTIGCFSSRKLIIWNNTPLSGEREVKGCVGRRRQQPVLCTQHSIECAVGTLQMTIDMKHTL